MQCMILHRSCSTATGLAEFIISALRFDQNALDCDGRVSHLCRRSTCAAPPAASTRIVFAGSVVDQPLTAAVCPGSTVW